MKHIWSIRLASAAEHDYREILRWTVKNFGRGRAKAYAKTLSAALHDLTLGPSSAGVRLRDDIGSGIHTLHVARKGRKGQHFVVFRVDPSGSEHFIDVLRVLHDSMDLLCHLPAAKESDSPTMPHIAAVDRIP